MSKSESDPMRLPLDAPADPVTTNTIVGDQNPNRTADLIGDTAANDHIEGGAGGDVILAVPGDDQLFGENYGDRETLIADGEVAQGINEKGDLASGDTGNDLIYGSDRNDALYEKMIRNKLFAREVFACV